MKMRNQSRMPQIQNRGALALCASFLLLALAGCGTRYSSAPPVEFWGFDMARQPKVGTQEKSAFSPTRAVPVFRCRAPWR